MARTWGLFYTTSSLLGVWERDSPLETKGYFQFRKHGRRSQWVLPASVCSVTARFLMPFAVSRKFFLSQPVVFAFCASYSSLHSLTKERGTAKLEEWQRPAAWFWSLDEALNWWIPLPKPVSPKTQQEKKVTYCIAMSYKAMAKF